MSLINKNKSRTPAQVVIQDVVKIKKGERVLIVANPATAEIAQDLYSASCDTGAQTTLMFQQDKTSFENRMFIFQFQISSLEKIRRLPQILTKQKMVRNLPI